LHWVQIYTVVLRCELVAWKTFHQICKNQSTLILKLVLYRDWWLKQNFWVAKERIINLFANSSVR